MPGALDTKLAEFVNETKNLRIALEKEVEERRRDHDKIIKLEEWCKTLFNRVEDLEQQDKDTEKEMQGVRGIAGRVTELENWRKQCELDEKRKLSDQLNENKVDAKAETKDKKSKFWDILMELFKIAVAAGLGALLGKKL